MTRGNQHLADIMTDLGFQLREEKGQREQAIDGLGRQATEHVNNMKSALEKRMEDLGKKGAQMATRIRQGQNMITTTRRYLPRLQAARKGATTC